MVSSSIGRLRLAVNSAGGVDRVVRLAADDPDAANVADRHVDGLDVAVLPVGGSHDDLIDVVAVGIGGRLEVAGLHEGEHARIGVDGKKRGVGAAGDREMEKLPASGSLAVIVAMAVPFSLTA